MGKKSRQKSKVERGKQKKAAADAAGGGSGEEKWDNLARRIDELDEADPASVAVARRLMTEGLLGHGADLDTPYAHFVASKWQAFAEQTAADASVDFSPDVLAGEWSKLSDAEQAAFTSPSSFPAAARVATDEASSSSTAIAAADKKGNATVGAPASTSAAADRAPLELKPNERTAYY
jgi:hypothetical protein